MKKIRIVVYAAVSLAVALTTALMAGHERVAVAGGTSLDERISVISTAPKGSVTSPEEMERNYRSCLFSFLPQIGSDAAAEILRDACRDEYLTPVR